MVKKSIMRKRIIWAISIVLLLAAGGAAAWWWHYSKTGTTPGHSDKDALVSLCEGDAAERMQKAIIEADHDTLVAHADKIMKISSYKTNASCVYIVAEAQVAKGSIAEAKTNFDTLTILRSDGENLDTEFSQQDVQIDALGDAVNFMQDNGVQTESESGVVPENVEKINEGAQQ